jgi:hypothetical protein
MKWLVPFTFRLRSPILGLTTLKLCGEDDKSSAAFRMALAILSAAIRLENWSKIYLPIFILLMAARLLQATL